MLKKVGAKCKRCKKEFCRRRTDQEFCSAQCRNASWKKPRKRRLKGTPRGSVANGPFSPTNSVACKPPQTSDLGAFVRAQIEVQQDRPNPIGFTLPDGTNGRAWLASDQEVSKIIGDDRLWRLNAEELLRQKERRPKAISWLPTAESLCRPIIVIGRNDAVRDVDDALRRVKGFRIRICIDRYSSPNQPLSEHALANALDVSTFLASGERINVLDTSFSLPRGTIKATRPHNILSIG